VEGEREARESSTALVPWCVLGGLFVYLCVCARGFVSSNSALRQRGWPLMAQTSESPFLYSALVKQRWYPGCNPQKKSTLGNLGHMA
jgi:hypothetical protein